MEKKVFEAPYLKVVNVKNDIITGSEMGYGGGTGAGGVTEAGAPRRRGMFDDDYSEDYDY